MKKSEIKLFRRWDTAVFAAVILLALVLFLIGLTKSGADKLVISIDGKESFYSLSENTNIKLENEGVTLTVTVKNGEAWVSETNCKNALCSHSGRIDRAGEIIVCAPARVSIRIIGTEGGEYDAVTG